MLQTKSSFERKTRTKKVKIPDSKKHMFNTMNDQILSSEIKRIPFSRMLKSEMADFVEKTIDIVESHDLESALITPVYQQLRGKEADIKLLRLSYGIDTERLRVSKMKREMMLVISAFKLQVRLLSKSNPELEMHPIQNAINKHLRHLKKCKNDKQLSQKVAGFLDLLNDNEEMATALSEFNLIEKVDTMKAAFSKVERASKKRVSLLSQRPLVSTQTIVKGMSKAIENLFKGIEVAHLIGTTTGGEPAEGQIDYVPLMDELNQLSEIYNRSISIRIANNKRKAQEKDGEDVDGDEPTDNSPTLPEGETPTHTQSSTMTNTEGNEDDEVVVE